MSEHDHCITTERVIAMNRQGKTIQQIARELNSSEELIILILEKERERYG